MIGERFPKKARLKRKKWIELLFQSGKVISRSPIRLHYQRHPDLPYSQTLFSVPKRIIKRSVDRNMVKRRMREVHRRYHQKLLCEHPPLLLGYTYFGNIAEAHYATILEQTVSILTTLKKRELKTFIWVFNTQFKERFFEFSKPITTLCSNKEGAKLAG